ncbi:diguanylate cyclase [Synechococcales cyanobacterium C]|uniref:Diguanylate cyclase n=2 Tax=Petrachloros TaxID=2918834 RepID=A0A8K1ZX50_9CYAN|nr:diguanylate cyclase [Petrachloros mirabilis]NCJ06885.1 diguanylate cyclase [Petrachloros mirabilis ULC683]
MALASWRFATVGAAFLWLIPVLIGYGFAKKLSQALQNERRSQEIYRSIFDHASDAIFLVEVSQGENTFRYLSANAAHGNQCGVLPSKMIHQPPESFLPPHIAAQVTAHYSQCAAQKATLTYELTLEQPAGTSTWHTTLTPMLNADGAVTLLVGISRNMTQQVQLTQKLERITQSLPGFVYQLQLKPDGTFCFPYASSTIETFFGLTPAEVEEDAEPLLSRIHPDDYDRVMQESMDSAATLSPWHCEFRMRNARDQIIWIDAYDIPQILEDGSILWTGYANDITERKHLEASLKASEEKFRVYVESANDIIFALSLDGILSYVSPNWTELLGHDTRDVIGQPFDRFVVSEDWPQCQVFLTQVLKTASKRSGIEYRVQCQNGTWRWHTSNVSPLFDEQGQVSACMGIARDITEQKQTAEHIQHLAHYDWLTDLPNRVLFFDLAQQALHRAEREGRYLALLFLDLDRFKTVNDTLGHEMGDRLLQAVAERIRDCLRLSDTVGRIGGDEFVVLLPVVATGEDAVVIAHRICDQLSCPFLIEGHRLRISASIGIALYPEHGSTIQELSKQADMAMYAAKQAGRNMVQVFQPE